MNTPLKIDAIRALARAGAIRHVQVTATKDGLTVEFNRSFYAANREDRPRYFVKADTCFNWLRELGLVKIDEVDLQEWNDST